MALEIYPTLPGLTLPILREAEFDSLVQTATNKYRTAQPQTINPIWHWRLIYDLIRDQSGVTFGVGEYRTLLDFFLYQGGQAGDFLYLDPDDNYVGPALLPSGGGEGYGEGGFGEGGYGDGPVPNSLAQLPLVTDDAGRWYSPLQRTLGGLFFEDITDLNISGAGGSAPQFYADGALKTPGTLDGGVVVDGDYVILGPGLAVPGASYMGLYLLWAAEPIAPITAQFNFYFRCHFESDSQDFEKMAQQLWTVGGSESKSGSGYVRLASSRPTPL